MYTGRTDWDRIKAVKESVGIPVIGNGDIFTAEYAKERIEHSGVDGVMLARGIFGNPWLIRDIREYLEYGRVLHPITSLDRINMAIEHTKRTQFDHPERPFIFELRKHICWYLKGIRNSNPIKDKINHTDKYEEVLDLLNILKAEIEKEGVEE